MSKCNHAIGAYESDGYVFLINLSDKDEDDEEEEPDYNEPIIFNYCPLCGEKLI